MSANHTLSFSVQNNLPATRRRVRICTAACAAVFLASASVHADTPSWNVAGDGNWTDGSSWDNNTPPVAGDAVTFNAVGVNAIENVYLNGDQAANSIDVTNLGATTLLGGASGSGATNTLSLGSGITVESTSGGLIIGGAGAGVNLSLTASQSFINNSSNLLTITNGISSGVAGTNVLTLGGSGNGEVIGTIANSSGITALDINGTGTWQLDGSSDSFNGGTTLDSGGLGIKSSYALGKTGSHALTINGGTIFSAGTTARTLPATVSTTINDDCTMGTGTAGTGQALTFSGTIDLGGGTRTIVFNNSSTWNGAVSDGGIIKADSGTNFTFLKFGSNANTYAGPTILLSGTIAPSTTNGGTNVFSPYSAFSVATGTTLDTAGYSEVIGSLSDYNGAGGTVHIGDLIAGVLTTGGDNTSTTFSGTIIGNGTTTPGGLTKTGTGTFTLAGTSNTFNGATSVQNGTLAVASIGDVGVGSSSLGNPILAASAISLGTSTTSGTLSYVGSTDTSTDRVIDLAGDGGLDSSGTGAITFTSDLTASGTAAKTLNLSGTNTGANTIQGAIPDNAPGVSTSVSKSGAGTWILAGANTYSGATTVNQGTLQISNSLTTSSAITVNGGLLQLSESGTHDHVINTGAVSVTAGAIDLADNKLITSSDIGSFNGTSYTGVTGLVASGRNGGTWNGPGIITSETQASTSILTTLGVATGAQAKGLAPGATAVWAGQTISDTSTLVMYTYAGDANLDGRINGDDYFAIDSHVNSAGASGYANGDFNYDGRINGDDYFIIDSNINQQSLGVFPTSAGVSSAHLSGVSAVPEPASLGLLAIGGCALLRRRRRTC